MPAIGSGDGKIGCEKMIYPLKNQVSVAFGCTAVCFGPGFVCSVPFPGPPDPVQTHKGKDNVASFRFRQFNILAERKLLCVWRRGDGRDEN